MQRRVAKLLQKMCQSCEHRFAVWSLSAIVSALLAPTQSNCYSVNRQLARKQTPRPSASMPQVRPGHDLHVTMACILAYILG